MSLQKRLVLGFLFVLSLIAVNVVIFTWSSRARAESLETLLQAIQRQVLIAAAQQHLRDLQKEMGLLTDLYTQPGAGVSDADEAAQFTVQLEAVRREVQEITALSPPDTAGEARAIEEACARLLASWRIAFESLGTDNARAITEMAVRADPIGLDVVQVRLPALERRERERVERARAASARVARLTDRVMLVIFVASVLLGAFVAYGLSSYMVAANRALEQGVAERTAELRQEVDVRRQAEEETRRSLSLLRATLESTADGLIVVDAANRILTWNQKFAEMFRIPSEILDSGDRRRITAFVREEMVDPEDFRRRVEELYADTEAEGFDILVLKDGRIFERFSQPQRLDGLSVGRVWSFRDVTLRRQAEEALRESEERYALAARGANDGLWDWNLKTGTIFLSARWKSMLGFEEHEIGNRPREWFRRVHSEDRDRLGVEIVAHLEGVTPHFEHEHRMRHKAGHYLWVLTRGLAERHAGEAYRMAGSQTDITLRKHAEERLVHDALHDALTGLPNRALFMDRLGSALGRRRRRPDFLFAVIFLDLDRFKVVNDGLGHLVGDQLLVGIARRLEACLRPGDTVARLGGDEFTLLLDDIKSMADATAVAERIQAALLQPFNLAGQEVFTTASLGIAQSGLGHERPEDLLRDSDTAMYRAKALGKARYVVFDEEMRARAVSLLRLESSLRSALKRQELRVHYQPIVSLESDEVVAVEALARWQHPDRGLISSHEFISIAEETGLIVPIGDWVMREACRQVVSWDAEMPGLCRVALSVNFSGRQFLQPDLVGAIQNALAESGLDARRLRLEITESIILDNLEAAREMLARLRGLGIRIHMDDFGTGYSSMSYLRDFQIDALKIDRSFVSHLGPDGDSSEIVRTIVALGQNLGLEVIAEGVETEDQVRQLRSLHCQFGQGYYFGGPLDQRGAQEWLAAAIR